MTPVPRAWAGSSRPALLACGARAQISPEVFELLPLARAWTALMNVLSSLNHEGWQRAGASGCPTYLSLSLFFVLTFDASSSSFSLGLLLVDPTGHVSTLTSEVGGKALLFSNSVSVSSEGTIYFTDSSTKYQRNQFPYEVFLLLLYLKMEEVHAIHIRVCLCL